MTARRRMLMASVVALTMLGVGASGMAAPNVTTCEGAIQGNVDDGARPDLLAIGNPKKHFACAFHHNTGKVAFNRTGTPLLLNQRVGRIEPFLMNVDFVRFFFETIIARNLNISFGSAIPNLSSQQINETLFPLPPLAEQHRIVAKIDALMALCDRLEASLTSAQDHSRRLLDALLAEALSPVEDRMPAEHERVAAVG